MFYELYEKGENIMPNDIKSMQNGKGEGVQPPKQDVNKFRQQALQATEAKRLSQQSPKNSEQKTSDEVIRDFEAALKREAALKQENADRQLATSQEVAEGAKLSASNSRKADLIKEQEYWMRDPSKKDNDVIVNMYPDNMNQGHLGQGSSEDTRQQEISQWYHWITDLNTKGKHVRYIRSRIQVWTS
jgi:hypothetical protein